MGSETGVQGGVREAADAGPPAIAFFDLDGTLVLGQTQRLLVGFLRRRGMVSRRFLVGAGLWFALYKTGLVKATDRARARGAELLAGHSEVEVGRLMDLFTNELLVARLNQAVVAALQDHKARGDQVVILSAAVQPLVRSLGGRLAVEACEGTRLETVQGRYTGSLAGRALYGAEKARAARRYLEKSGVDPARCWAYADHETDLELLRLVGWPVAVRPRPALRKVALAEGWSIVP